MEHLMVIWTEPTIYSYHLSCWGWKRGCSPPELREEKSTTVSSPRLQVRPPLRCSAAWFYFWLKAGAKFGGFKNRRPPYIPPNHWRGSILTFLYVAWKNVIFFMLNFILFYFFDFSLKQWPTFGFHVKSFAQLFLSFLFFFLQFDWNLSFIIIAWIYNNTSSCLIGNSCGVYCVCS